MKRKPAIGITSSKRDGQLSLPMENILAIAGAGGVPLVLPNLTEDESMIAHYAESIDGLLLTGGGDIDPTLFGEEPIPGLGNIYPERDAFEMALSQEMLSRDKPILAICRGCQILNIAAGGDMYQDLPSQKTGELLQHTQNAPRWHASHFVTISEGTLLSEIAQAKRIKVNSYHHQAVRLLPKSFKVSAVSSDGVIEALESLHHTFVLGLQWHPECMVTKKDGLSLRIFDTFIKACER